MATGRKKSVKYILDNMIDIEDDVIDVLYDKIIEYVPNKLVKKTKLKRLEKVLYINSNLMFIESVNIDKLKDIIYDSLNHIETENEKKTRITLEIVNKILEANDMKQINKLIEFIRVKRDVIISEETNKIIDDNKEYIFNNGFSKVGCKVYHTYIKTPQFSILKGMLKEIGYEMKSKTSSKYVDKVREMYMVYTICKTN
jgi:hypothetical protein